MHRLYVIDLDARKKLSSVFANDKGAHQSAHGSLILISTFVTRFLESIISYLVTSEISVLLLSRLV